MTRKSPKAKSKKPLLAVSIDTFGIGADTGQPVALEYKPPFAFNGPLKEVRIELR